MKKLLKIIGGYIHFAVLNNIIANMKTRFLAVASVGQLIHFNYKKDFYFVNYYKVYI